MGQIYYLLWQTFKTLLKYYLIILKDYKRFKKFIQKAQQFTDIIKEYCLFNKIPFLINRCGLLAGSGQLYKNDQGIISFWINSWKNKKKLSN